jgi:hypothetical protein
VTTTQDDLELPDDCLVMSISRPGHVCIVLNVDDITALNDRAAPDEYVQQRSIGDLVEDLLADCVGDSGVPVGEERIFLEKTAEVFEHATARLRQTLSSREAGIE